MDAVRSLLRRVTSLGGELRVVGDRIKYRGPRGRLTDEMRAEIREHRLELLERLPKRTVAELVVAIADLGAYPTLESGRVGLREHDWSNLSATEHADLLDDFLARKEEIKAWLGSPLSEEDLAVLSFAPDALDDLESGDRS